MHELLYALFTGFHHKERDFKNNIRFYNIALAFASLGRTKIVADTTEEGVWTFRSDGDFYHQICETLIQDDNASPQYN